jgi:hypothetical protein
MPVLQHLPHSQNLTSYYYFMLEGLKIYRRPAEIPQSSVTTLLRGVVEGTISSDLLYCRDVTADWTAAAWSRIFCVPEFCPNIRTKIKIHRNLIFAFCIVWVRNWAHHFEEEP